MTDKILESMKEDFEVLTASEMSAEPLSMLVYGPSGVGKTVFCGTAKNLLLADCEGGTMPLRARSDVKVARIRSYDHIFELHKLFATREHKYETVAIDTVDHLQWLALRKICEEDTHTKRPGEPGFPKTPCQQDWSTALNMMLGVVVAYRKLRMNKIYVCHSKDAKDDDLGTVDRGPSLGGQFAQKIQELVDLVAYMDLVKTGEGMKRVLYVQPVRGSIVSSIAAKDRIGLGAPIIEPDFEAILRKYRGEKKEPVEGPAKPAPEKAKAEKPKAEKAGKEA